MSLVSLPVLPLPVIGGDLLVPTLDGSVVRYANLDYAASAPSLAAVRDALDELLPWYSSVHRGAGFASTVCTEVYAASRRTIASFVGARTNDTLLFTRNTTDALNLLASLLPPDTAVIAFESEHHANLLPWQRIGATVLPLPATPADAVAAVERALRAVDATNALVAVTGASNVTGELWPVREIAAVARRYGARTIVDAAQLAPHRRIDLDELGVDYLAFSGHKLYAPYGAGVLVGRSDWLDAGRPYLAGGGAVRRVTRDGAEWATGHARHEGGTPNVLGVAALAAACLALEEVSMEAVEQHEQALLARLRSGLAQIPGIETYSLWGETSERIGVLTFNLTGWHHNHLAAVLSAEHGIGVRDGAFCAHPLVQAIVGDDSSGDVATPLVGAVRVSFGVGTTTDDVDRLLRALRTITTTGSTSSYVVHEGRYAPAVETRVQPSVLGRFGHVAPAFDAACAGSAVSV